MMIEHAEIAQLSGEELAEFKAVAASFAQDVPGHDWADLDIGDLDAIDRSWQGLCEIGFDRCLADEAVGGTNLSPDALTTLLEELATGDGGVALLMLLSNIAVEASGNNPVEMDTRLVYVPTVGSRVGEARMPRLEGGELSGAAPFVLGGGGAGTFVVTCLYDGAPALALVERDAFGLVISPVTDQLGLGSARAARLTFVGSPATLIGDADDVDRADAMLALGTSAIARGVARRARRLAQEYAENRYQGGGQIIIHGAVRDMLARMSERELGMPQPLSSTAGDALAVGLAAKIAATDAAVLTTIDAIQVFGGMGYMRETGVEKLMRDAKYLQLYPRPNWLCRDELLELQRHAA
jgi:alkylation response protein AidB-like acyl-CoA dehydrogenase